LNDELSGQVEEAKKELVETHKDLTEANQEIRLLSRKLRDFEGISNSPPRKRKPSTPIFS